MEGPSRQYLELGVIDARIANGRRVGGASVPGVVRIALLGCGECGAMVSEGPGRNAHDRWHAALSAAVPPISSGSRW